MRENMRASECVISRISRVLQEARKREIVGSIVGNNGTPKLPFPTSSSLARNLLFPATPPLRGIFYAQFHLRASILRIDINVPPPSPWININRRSPYVLVLHARGLEGLFLLKTFILTGSFAAGKDVCSASVEIRADVHRRSERVGEQGMYYHRAGDIN